jgi:hypothetical protein
LKGGTQSIVSRPRRWLLTVTLFQLGKRIMWLKIIVSTKLMLLIVAAALGLPLLPAAQPAKGELKKTYRSEAGSFEVSYPNDWTVSGANRDKSLVAFFTSPEVFDECLFRSARIMVCSTPINEKAWNDCTERDSHLAELYKDTVQSRKELVVGGLKIERSETASKHDDGFFYYARFSSHDRKFFVRGNFGKAFNLDRYAPVFDQILESFRLSPIQQTVAGPPPVKTDRYYLRVSGCDDRGRAYLNNQMIVDVGFDEDSNWLDITEAVVRGRDEIRFEVVNTTGAITYVFQVRKNDTMVFEQACGKAREVGCENNRAFRVGIARQFTYAISTDK